MKQTWNPLHKQWWAQWHGVQPAKIEGPGTGDRGDGRDWVTAPTSADRVIIICGFNSQMFSRNLSLFLFFKVIDTEVMKMGNIVPRAGFEPTLLAIPGPAC